MQLGDPSVLETSSGEAVAAEEATAAPTAPESGEGGGGDEGNNKINFGGNRWPRQETLALLKIRSDMDAVFRDSSLKGPLWEEVARKLADLGYQRSAKKCKEKFENVYKYHKRTKESRSGKSEGKTYKFFDQLQALENQFTVSSSSSYPPKPQPPTTTTTSATNTVTLLPTRPTTPAPIPCATTVPSTNPTVVIHPSPSTTITSTTVVTNPRNPSSQPNTTTITTNNNNNASYTLPNMNLFSSTSTSSSTASDEDLEEKYRKKRKWKEYFRRLTRQVLTKQEEMQKRFLEAIDKREREQAAQQDAWRIQEMARVNREHEILVQERSTAAAKDAAVIAFLQKLSGQQSPITTQVATTVTFGGNFLLQQSPTLPPPPQPQSQPQPQLQQQQQPPLAPLEIMKVNNNGNNGGPLMSPSRWPKAEVHALIRLRTSLEAKYLENGPKAPLWEDISAGMQRLGYNRNAKRCKEKWENINKYFKKVKESKKQRREDSKTCPYFQELDAIYKEKGKNQNPFGSSFHNMKPNEMMMEPLMVQPEQQWRPPPQYEQHEHMEEDHHVVKNNNNSNNNGDNYNNACQEREAYDEEEVDDNDDDGEDEDEDGDSVEDEGGNSRYEIATNKLSSVDTVE